jgi:hypothetical protein
MGLIRARPPSLATGVSNRQAEIAKIAFLSRRPNEGVDYFFSMGRVAIWRSSLVEKENPTPFTRPAGSQFLPLHQPPPKMTRETLEFAVANYFAVM